MKPFTNRSFAAVVAVTALSLSLAALPGAAGAQVQHQSPGGLTGALPDLMPTTLGLVLKNGGPTPWGGTKVIDKPTQIDGTQAGPQHNLCHVDLAAYRTFNKGDGDAAGFVTKTYRDGALAHSHNVPAGLASKDFIDWHPFQIDLKEGMNVIRVVFDANKQVAETDENNTYAIRVEVKLDCNGDGKIGGVAVPGGGLKAAPGRPDRDPVKPRNLRLAPRA